MGAPAPPPLVQSGGNALSSCGGACGPSGACGAVCGPGAACGVTGCALGCDDKGESITSYSGNGCGEYVATTTYQYVGPGCGEYNTIMVPTAVTNRIFFVLPCLSLLALLLWALLLPRGSYFCGQCIEDYCPHVKMHQCQGCLTKQGAFMTQGNPCGTEFCSKAEILQNCETAASSNKLCTTLPDPTQVCVPEPVTPTPAPLGPPGVCILFGDPHIMSFDHKRVDFYTQGEYWIVKSEQVHIQARYRPTHMTSGLSVTKEIVFSGPFLKCNVLRLSALAASWNGQAIIPSFPSDYTNDLVQIHYNSMGATMQDGREGKALHVVHITMPGGVQVEVNRWNEPGEGSYINVRITMPAQPGQDGHCGNFNGNPADDDRLQIRARVGTTGVAAGELYFHTKTAVVQVYRPDINNCPAPQLDSAKDLCKKKEHKFIPSMSCLVDVCFGGKQFASEA